MQLKTSVVVFLISITTFTIMSTSCNGGKSDLASFGSFNIPSTPPPTPPIPSSPSGSSSGIVSDADFFYIGVDTTKNDSIVHVHDATSFSKTCAVAKTNVTSNEDIQCMVEMPEADLYLKDLNLQINVPPEMCRYLAQDTYWFYNSDVGVGPKAMAISVDNTVNASGDITATSYTCTIDSLLYPGCTGHPELTASLTPANQTFSCIYNRATSGGEDCCTGTLTIAKTVLTNGANPVNSSSITNWGSSLKKCIGGPGRTNWPIYKPDGLPATFIKYTKDGLKSKYTVTSPSKLGPTQIGLDPLTASIHMANSFSDTSANHTHSGFVDPTTSASPFFIAPIDDLTGDSVAKSNSAYTFSCLDEAFEIKHRIRVYVRDWDVYTDFKTYITTLGLTFVPNRSGFGIADPLEPSADCTGITGLCNDFRDIDDFLNLNLIEGGVLAAPTYNTAVKAKRKFYFPNIKY